MTVGELRERLEDYNEDAEVLIASQPHWPFEYAVSGLCSREEVENETVDNDEAVDGTRAEGAELSDVFLVEGRQLRYGSKVVWDVARR